MNTQYGDTDKNLNLIISQEVYDVLLEQSKKVAELNINNIMKLYQHLEQC